MPNDAMQKESYTREAEAFDQSFISNPCRYAYDTLGWRTVSTLTLPPKARIIDAGCGTGRWSQRFLALGHHVTGIENAPGMIASLEQKHLGPEFALLAANMEAVHDLHEEADLVIAIGSLQYCVDPDGMIHRFHNWLKPGGQIAVMVDSLVALVSEFLQTGQHEKAEHILRTREGSFTSGNVTTTLRLYDRLTLQKVFAKAGFENIQCRGLVAQGASLGRKRCAEAIREDAEVFLSCDERLANNEVMADSGLHLMLTAQRPYAENS